jgi:bifunctional N-acetylglucosamine-1-phosphate-uridyltransferase/glucosamine-1-phosphate-acetyltransferase GlmU-like protein
VTRRVLLVPAAGLGTRLNAGKPKALVDVNGKPMLDYLRQLYRSYVAAMVVVAHPSAVEDVLRWARATPENPADLAGPPIEVIQQPAPTGMLDAILLAAPAVLRHDPDWIWITWSDQVGVLPETASRLEEATAVGTSPALVLPTVRRPHPYTHFERSAGGAIVRLLQRREGDRMPDEGESDMGVFALTRRTFERELPNYARTVVPAGGTGERNFLPFVPWLAARAPIVTIPATDAREAIGINTPEDLRMMEQWLRSRTA